MENEQAEILYTIENSLPVKQFIELNRQIRLYRLELRNKLEHQAHLSEIELQNKTDLTKEPWKFHFDMISMYLNFPFLY